LTGTICPRSANGMGCRPEVIGCVDMPTDRVIDPVGCSKQGHTGALLRVEGRPRQADHTGWRLELNYPGKELVLSRQQAWSRQGGRATSPPPGPRRLPNAQTSSRVPDIGANRRFTFRAGRPAGGDKASPAGGTGGRGLPTGPSLSVVGLRLRGVGPTRAFDSRRQVRCGCGPLSEVAGLSKYLLS